MVVVGMVVVVRWPNHCGDLKGEKLWSRFWKTGPRRENNGGGVYFLSSAHDSRFGYVPRDKIEGNEDTVSVGFWQFCHVRNTSRICRLIVDPSCSWLTADRSIFPPTSCRQICAVSYLITALFISCDLRILNSYHEISLVRGRMAGCWELPVLLSPLFEIVFVFHTKQW